MPVESIAETDDLGHQRLSQFIALIFDIEKRAASFDRLSRATNNLQLVTIDPHSPPQFRANGAAVNSDGFQDAFGTKPGDGMYKAPEDRIRLW